MPENSEPGLHAALFKPDDALARTFTSQCPEYRETPLHETSQNGESLWIKDESTRFGLGSFKALGGIYAVAQLLIQSVKDQQGTVLDLDDQWLPTIRKAGEKHLFICASAGNHGLAVATGARLFGARARIHVSAEVPSSFSARLQAAGAEVCQSGDTYEDSLAAANHDVENSEGLLLADGSWPGYVKPPGLVMEGYTVLANELSDQFNAMDQWPSDVYLQAGVGGMAAAVAWVIRRRWREQPRIVVVEPTAAPCLALSAEAGELTAASGPVSNMGRLDCKEASLLAADCLARCDVTYQQVSDEQAAVAVNDLAGLGFATTPSGGAGYAAWRLESTLDKKVGPRPLIIMSEQPIHDSDGVD